VFSLALSESNRRKEIRSQAQQPAPQPKVVDQELAEMDIRKELPENLGIARLPVDMNMASGGIVAFGDGGMSHYDKGGDIKNAGSDPKLAYRQYALTQANKMGLDPALVDSIFQIESGYNPEAVSPKGAVGIGQLMPKTAAGQGVKDSTDPYQNIDASLRELKSLQKKYDNDTTKIAAAYNWGQGNLDKHLNRNDGEINANNLPKETKSYIKKITDLIPLSSANAEVVQPATKSSSLRDLLPNMGGDKVSSQSLSDLVTNKPQPTPVTTPEKSWWDSANEKAEYLMNPPKKSGVAYDPKTFRNPEAQAIQPLYPELVALGAPGRMASIAKRILDTKPAVSEETTAGLPSIVSKPAPQEAPTPPSQGLIKRDLSTAEREQMNMGPKGTAYPVGEEASTMNFLARQRLARQGAAKGAAQAEEASAAAPNAIRQLPPRSGSAANAFRNVQAGQVGINEPSSEAGIPSVYKSDEAGNLLNRYPAPTSAAVDDRTKRDPANYKPEEKKQIVEAAKDAVPKSEDTDGWSKNDWLQFGLAMMAGQSPHALSNIGAAGLSVLAAKQAKQLEKDKLENYRLIYGGKQEREVAIKQLMDEDPSLSYSKALAKYTQLIEPPSRMAGVDTKGEKIDSDKLKAFQDAKTKLYGDFKMYMTGNGTAAKAQQAEYKKQLQELHKAYNIPMEETATASSASGWGLPTKQ